MIDRAVKTYDYINRVFITLPLTVYEGMWTHSSRSLLCITMILHVRRIFFEITTFPNGRGLPSGPELAPASGRGSVPMLGGRGVVATAGVACDMGRERGG